MNHIRYRCESFQFVVIFSTARSDVERYSREYQLKIEPCDKSKKRKLVEDDHSVSEVRYNIRCTLCLSEGEVLADGSGWKWIGAWEYREVRRYNLMQ
jgi:hypothetical protein